MSERRPSAWLLALAALVSGGLLLLGFPPFGLYPLVWVALAPLLWAVSRVRRPGQGALLGLLAGLAFFGGLHRYLLMYGVLPTFLVALLEALPVAVFGALAVKVAGHRHMLVRSLGLAGAWVLSEWLRQNLGDLSLTLGQLGYSQQSSLPLLQSASVAGALGLSFLLVLFNAAFTFTVAPERAEGCGGGCARVLALGLVAACVGLVYLGGYLRLRLPPPTGLGLVAGVVQPNPDLETPVAPEDQEECLRAYPRYTEALMAPWRGAEREAAGRPQLVVWPETAFPAALNTEPRFWGAAAETAQANRVWLLMGALEVTEDGRVYNNAWLFDPQGQLRGKYSKNDLVMFGEYVPFRDRLPFLRRYPIRDFDFTPGTGRDLLSVEGQQFGTLICFEAIFSGPARDLVRRGAQFLVFITSDAWAGPSHEVLLHSQTAPLRAVETGRWVVRSAATGRSVIISPRGEVVASVEPWHAGVAAGQITLLRGLTPYALWGDWPLLGLSALLTLVAWTRWRKGEE